MQWPGPEGAAAYALAGPAGAAAGPAGAAAGPCRCCCLIPILVLEF